MMDGWHSGWGSGWWILMPILWIVLIGAIVWAVTQLFPGRDGRHSGNRRDRLDETPEEILDRRLASGEIDVETYDATREKLRAVRVGRRGE